MATRDEMARSFGAAASTYESGRPEYPADAVRWMLAPIAAADTSIRVADVGAGTGKLTRVLETLGAQTVAIDPDPGMLAALHQELPAIPTFVGAAEQLPLPDASVDAVVLGQAWHWVDVPVASREVGRVLRSGGVLGLIWNLRDDSVDWVAQMTEIMHGSNAEIMMAEGGPTVDTPFDGIEKKTWEWMRPMTRSSLLDMVRSRSYFITADDTERVRVEAELGTLFDRIGAVGEASVDLPYLTHAFRAVRM
ncbi:class I SAM-dependent methyltransferase [Microbacterium sp. ASV49]|uniref:Class I SAM-dependent methyltransferase n=1 Tax=Microbacterium candidum TaxID=3041922 RepID=A0ABT7N251_9MICO|nr:class I SAM-dependent methyltransferase [Microbacterium sp. ASV49]MDL9980795.1 class I SAM-dependent methyltransferase [Microbacterium sp. ASV49]